MGKIILENCESHDSGQDGLHVAGDVNLEVNMFKSFGSQGHGIRITADNAELQKLLAAIKVAIDNDPLFDVNRNETHLAVNTIEEEFKKDKPVKKVWAASILFLRGVAEKGLSTALAQKLGKLYDLAEAYVQAGGFS